MISAVLLVACTIDASSARKLIEAKTIHQLEAAYHRIPAGDVAMRALYHHQRLALHPTATEELRFLRTLPSTEAEFRCIYGLGELYNRYDLDPFWTPASATVYGDFETAAQLAVKHHTGHARVLAFILATWSNAEVGEVSFPEINELLDRDPEPTADAIRALPVRDQRQLCGHDVRKRSTKFIVKQCRSELD